MGAKSKSRTNMRVICQSAVLDASHKAARKRQSSATFSTGSNTTGPNSSRFESEDENTLKKLQKECLMVSRLGFPEKAMELDREIEYLRGLV